MINSVIISNWTRWFCNQSNQETLFKFLRGNVPDCIRKRILHQPKEWMSKDIQKYCELPSCVNQLS